jgi:hypothetical protein
MSKRPAQHKIGDQGLAEVTRILANAGWACESVKADYGEDLLCQTDHEGFVDPHRILVQVKSTRNKLGRSNQKIKIKKDTLIKWLSDSNLVVICLWSTLDKSALYLIPNDKYSLYKIDLSPKPNFSIEFSQKSVWTRALQTIYRGEQGAVILTVSFSKRRMLWIYFILGCSMLGKRF